jgi:inward rectifier potassium channel
VHASLADAIGFLLLQAKFVLVAFDELLLQAMTAETAAAESSEKIFDPVIFDPPGYVAMNEGGMTTSGAWTDPPAAPIRPIRTNCPRSPQTGPLCHVFSLAGHAPGSPILGPVAMPLFFPSAQPRITTTAEGVTVIGAPRDFYYLLLRVRWSIAIAFLVVIYFAANALFAVFYLVSGGVTGAQPGSFFDALCFSVETMGTIGYGGMYPTSHAANVIMMVESVTSLLFTAVATGLVFAKFSRSTARVAFSRHAVVGPMDGFPTLMLRVGNERGNQILEATIRVSVIRTEVTREGSKFYRMYDLKLARERSPAMQRSWTVLHRIDSESPLFGATPESAQKEEFELMATLVGTDDTSLQPVHARRRYLDHEIVWGARHADILSEDSEGNITLDIRRFHEILPTEPIDGFPFPRPPAPNERGERE